MIAIYNDYKDISPSADGPLSSKPIPLIQVMLLISKIYMLNSLCIKTINARIRYYEYCYELITEDNIDQLDSMSYSDNARKLLWTTTLDDKAMFKQLGNTIIKKQNNYAREPKAKQETPDKGDSVEGPETPESPPYNAFDDYSRQGPMFSTQVIYNIGDTVTSQEDPNKERLWQIISIDNEDIIIESMDLKEPLPDSIIQTTQSIQLITTKDQITHYSPASPISSYQPEQDKD